MKKGSKDEKILSLTDFDVKKYISQIQKLIDKKEIYSAFLLYRRLSVRERVNALPFIASFYARVGAVSYEIDSLIEILSHKSFSLYNPNTLYERVVSFFKLFAGADVSEFYEEYLDNIFGKHSKMLLDDELSKYGGFSLVDSDFCYDKAMQYAHENEQEKTRFWLEQIDENSKNYSKAQSFLSVLDMMQGDNWSAIDKSKKAYMAEGGADTVVFLKQLAGVVPERKDEVYDFILKSDKKSLKNSLVKADIYVSKGELEKAIEELKSIDGERCYTEEYLEKLAKIYILNGEKENAIETLKMIATIYNKNVDARFQIKKLMASGDVKKSSVFVKNTELKAEINYFLSFDKKKFLALSNEEMIYYYHIVCRFAEPDVMKKVTLIYLKTPASKDIVFQKVLEVDFEDYKRQIIFSTIIQAGKNKSFYYFYKGFIREFKMTYPKFLYSAEITDPFKLSKNLSDKDIYKQYLVNCFSQAVSLCVFQDIDFEIDENLIDYYTTMLLSESQETLDFFGSVGCGVYYFYKIIADPSSNKKKKLFKDLKPEDISRIEEVYQSFKEI